MVKCKPLCSYPEIRLTPNPFVAAFARLIDHVASLFQLALFDLPKGGRFRSLGVPFTSGVEAEE